MAMKNLFNEFKIWSVRIISRKIDQIRDVHTIIFKTKPSGDNNEHESFKFGKIKEITNRKHDDIICDGKCCKFQRTVITNTFKLITRLSDKEKIMLDYHARQFDKPNI